jgi:acyl-homoserine-lactone acylase
MTQQRVDGTDHKGPRGFTLGDMQKLVFSDRQYGGELVRDATVSMCRHFPGGMAPSSSGPVPVGSSCNVLAAWDRHENLGSRGAVLFNRFWTRALASETSPFANPFNASDPVHTPNGLNTNDPEVQRAFGDALNDLKGAGIKVDAAPRNVQFATRGHAKIPIHGGSGDPNGEFNAIWTDFTPGKGFSDVNGGSSYVQAVTWGKSSCPRARTILTYSESSNPRSKHSGDQTRLFSRKRWVRERFCRRDVLRGTKLTTRVARGKRTRNRRHR